MAYDVEDMIYDYVRDQVSELRTSVKDRWAEVEAAQKHLDNARRAYDHEADALQALEQWLKAREEVTETPRAGRVNYVGTATDYGKLDRLQSND